METTETVTNPVIGVNILSQEGTTGSEDNGEKITNQKRWKRLAREKYGSANEGNQSLGKRDGDMDIEEYSDRKKIRKTFPDAIVLHKAWMGSDHKAIIIDKVYKKDPIKGKNRGGGNRFLFEHAWAEEAECRSIVEKAWTSKTEEADLILSIPLSAYPAKDSILWHYNKEGTFSVKSAYRIAISAIRNGEASCSFGPLPWWKKLWCLQIPNKIKIFCWKACRNILPTKELLYTRGIIDLALCPLCNEGPKTVDHALWGCKTVKSDWIQCPLFSDIKKLKVSEFLERVIWVAAVSNLDIVTKFITTAWFVWNNRNKILFGDKAKSSGESWKKATLFLSDGKNSENKTKISVVSSNEITKWIPPNKDTFKVNVDAFLDQGRSRFSAGIIIRDSTGRIKRAAAMVFNGKVSVEIAEAKAIHEGLLLAMRSGLHPLIIEFDSLNVVLLNRDKRSSIVHTPRSCNTIAHEIARRAIGLENSVLMVDLFPPWLQKLAVSDVNSNTSAVE
ncbi:hypothetical protein Q3G72_018129 [Acer saccharum]|nr:hypothetical protein Q3G72_018129 [Acer saccharum]